MNIIVTKEQAKFILESKNSDVDERSRSFAFTRKRRLFSKGEMMANPDRYKYYDKKQKHVLETGEIDEIGNINMDIRKWSPIISSLVAKSGVGETITINGRDYPNEYKGFPVDIFHVRVVTSGGGAYDENQSGYDNNGKYVVYFVISKFDSELSIDSILNHELRHAFEDYMRISKNKTRLSKTKEGSQYFSGDFEKLMTTSIVGPYNIFRSYIRALYFTSKLEESGFSETIYDGTIYDGKSPSFIKDEMYHVKRLLGAKRTPEEYKREWDELKNNVRIPIFDRFNDYQSFIRWANKTIIRRFELIKKKFMKIKYMKDNPMNEGEITETRSSYLSFIVNKVKEITGEEWPEYVLKDWLYKNTKSYDPGMDTRVGYKKLVYRFIRDFTNEYGQGHWVHKVVTLGFDSFTQDTKKGIQSRHGGRVPVPGIHNDIERHRIQNNLIQKRGVSNEPIILVQKTDGYDLLEGWHRTIQSLENFKTYEQPAYIYVPN